MEIDQGTAQNDKRSFSCKKSRGMTFASCDDGRSATALPSCLDRGCSVSYTGRGGTNHMARIEIGEYLASDSRICGGRLILKGGRILVADVLGLVQAGYTPEAIAQQYRGIIRQEAVREAVSLTRQGRRSAFGW